MLGDRLSPSMADYGQLRYVLRCVNESMRLYPHPPVLLRRALVPDELPGGYKVGSGQLGNLAKSFIQRLNRTHTLYS